MMNRQNLRIVNYLFAAAVLCSGVIPGHAASAQENGEGNTTTVNVSQNQSTIVVVPTPQPSEPADAVVFVVTDDREIARPGEILTYRIVVRNQRSDDINQVRIIVRIPDFLIPTATAPAAEVNPGARTLTWSNLNLSARAEQTYAIRAQVVPEAPHGQKLRLLAEINGPGVRGSFTDTTQVEENAVHVAESAATTTAPSSAPTATPTTPPVAVPTTARTGSSFIAMAFMSLISGTGIVLAARKN